MEKKDGSNYLGSWKLDKIDGFGIYQWFNANTYIGQWKNNSMHGKGVLISNDGTESIGDF